MHYGVAHFPTAYPMPAPELGPALEERGFESIWVAEHTHIPADRASPNPGGGELPQHYYDTLDPFLFLTAVAAATARLKVATGICLVVERDPITTAKEVASLDVLSGGRFLFGIGPGWNAEEMENHGTAFDTRFRVMVDRAKAMKAIWTQEEASFHGEFVDFDAVWAQPKPVQKPHPPLWVACSNRETIHLAARLGIGALTFAFVDPTEARKWVGEYYEIIKTECKPIGHAVNANVAMVTGFSCHPDEQEARRRGEDGFRFFGYGLGHHYIFGSHKPGRTNIWENFERARDSLPAAGEHRGIGTPDQLRAHLSLFEETGVDQVIFIQQAGLNKHEHICDSLELFAREVMPEFKERDPALVAAKEARFAPAIEAALARKQPMPAPADEDIPTFPALGRQIVIDAEKAKGA